MAIEVTPIVITFNEQDNIGRVLERLSFATRVIVVDSGSTDETLAICHRFPNVHIVSNPFRSPAEQFNFGANHAASNWVLALGADYVLSDDLIEELRTFAPSNDVDVFLVHFKYAVYGRELRTSIYPAAKMLYRRDRFRFEQDGHTERLSHRGDCLSLKGKIIHDDRKPISRWFNSQFKYAQQECRKLHEVSFRSLSWKNKIRIFVLVAPLLVFLYCMFCKCLFLDGRRGIYYSLQRTVAELILSICLLDQKLRDVASRR